MPPGRVFPARVAEAVPPWHSAKPCRVAGQIGIQPIVKYRVALLAALAFAALTAAADAAQFVPYRALYDMTLNSATRDSAVANVTGQIDEEWNETCDGWTMQQRTALEVAIGGEASVRLLSNVTTWESRNGLIYRFNVRNRSSDSEEERIEGMARLAGPGKAGTAKFEQPEARSMKLPAGTIFPTAHTNAVLEAAKDAPTALTRVVFDGLSGDGLFDVSAILGRAAASDAAPSAKVRKVLAGLRAWPAQIAFFRHGSHDAEPDHEVGLKLYENGVTDEMILDFGPFTARATIKALELSPRPACNPGR